MVYLPTSNTPRPLSISTILSNWDDLPEPPADYFPTTIGGSSALVIKRLSTKGPAARLMQARKRTLRKAHFYGVPESYLCRLPGIHRTFLYTYLERYVLKDLEQ